MDRLTEVIHDDWEHSRLLDVDERAVESGGEREFEAQLTKADSMLDFAKRDQITLLVRGDQSVLRDQCRVSGFAVGVSAGFPNHKAPQPSLEFQYRRLKIDKREF